VAGPAPALIVTVDRAASAKQITLSRVAVSAASELAIAAVLLYIAKRSIPSLFEAPAGVATQAFAGIALGALIAVVQIALLRRFDEWQAFSRRAIEGTKLGAAEIVVVSVLVGIAEETLFRAALQPLLGLWLASLLFAAVHVNYAALRGRHATRLLSILALSTVFALGVCLGIVFERLGLVAAMTMHATYDMLVLLAYRKLFAWDDRGTLTTIPRARGSPKRGGSQDPRR
jgi:membrane protease YdiL (CAAX protease family)